MKLREQNEGPGAALSHNATKGLLWAKLSVNEDISGVGKILNVLTMPCLQDKTSVASPFAGMVQT